MGRIRLTKGSYTAYARYSQEDPLNPFYNGTCIIKGYGTSAEELIICAGAGFSSLTEESTGGRLVLNTTPVSYEIKSDGNNGATFTSSKFPDDYTGAPALYKGRGKGISPDVAATGAYFYIKY